MNKIETIQTILEQAETARQERVLERTKPIIQQEFDRLRSRYGLERILFGNGTFVFRFKEGSRYEDMAVSRLPKAFDSLYEMCVLVLDDMEDVY